MNEQFVQIQRSEATKRNYAYDLGKWFTFLAGREPSEQIALEFRGHLTETMSSSSAARIFNTCRTYYRWLAGPRNVFERIPSPKTVKNRVPKVPEDAIVEQMLDRCTDERDKAVLALLLNGLRSEEVTRLTASDYQYVAAYETHILNVLGKGDKARRVPATLETVTALAEYLPMRNRGSEWLLQGSQGNQMTTRQVQYVAEKYSDYKVRPHRLRHHYATRLVRNGASLIAVRDLLGHADVQTTQIYASLDLAGIIEASKLDPRNR